MHIAISELQWLKYHIGHSEQRVYIYLVLYIIVSVPYRVYVVDLDLCSVLE